MYAKHLNFLVQGVAALQFVCSRFTTSNICKSTFWKLWGGIRDDPKLLDDSGKVPKIKWSGGQFDLWPWNLLSTWQENQPSGHAPVFLKTQKYIYGVAQPKRKGKSFS